MIKNIFLVSLLISIIIHISIIVFPVKQKHFVKKIPVIEYAVRDNFLPAEYTTVQKITKNIEPGVRSNEHKKPVLSIKSQHAYIEKSHSASTEYRTYSFIIRNKIKNSLSESVPNLNGECEINLTIIIGKTGNIIKLNAADNSRQPGIFREYVFNTIRYLQFPPFPPEITTDSITVNLPIYYRKSA